MIGSVVIAPFSQRGAPLSWFFPWWQVLPVLRSPKEGPRRWGSDSNPQRQSTKCFRSDVHTITPLLLTSTVGILPKTLCWRSPGFYHKPAPAQRGDAPDSALQRGPDARLGGRIAIFDGGLVLPRHHFTGVTVVSDCSVFQSGRFVWLDGSSWVYADWGPGKPRPTSNVDNCVELLGRAEVTPLPSFLMF